MVEGIYKEYKNENKTKLNVKFKFLVGHLFALLFLVLFPLGLNQFNGFH